MSSDAITTINPATGTELQRYPTMTAAQIDELLDSVDALSLLLGSDAAKGIVRPALFGATYLIVGYLYGKNRTLERILRRG